MSEGIVNRVARALYRPHLRICNHAGAAPCVDDCGCVRNLYPLARSAIEALREPTPGMIDAACHSLEAVPKDDFMAASLSPDRWAMAKLKAPIRWRAMIDAASAEGGP